MVVLSFSLINVELCYATSPLENLPFFKDSEMGPLYYCNSKQTLTSILKLPSLLYIYTCLLLFQVPLLLKVHNHPQFFYLFFKSSIFSFFN
jgi:hypothetical protein